MFLCVQTVTAEAGAIKEKKTCAKDEACYEIVRKLFSVRMFSHDCCALPYPKCPPFSARFAALYKGVIPNPPVTIDLKGADANQVVSYHFTNTGVSLKSGLITGLMFAFAVLMSGF